MIKKIAKIVYRIRARYEIPEVWKDFVLQWADGFEDMQKMAFNDAASAPAVNRSALLESLMKEHGRETLKYVMRANGLTRAVNNVLYQGDQKHEKAALKPMSTHRSRAIAENIAQVASVIGGELDVWLEYGSRGTPSCEFGWIKEESRL